MTKNVTFFVQIFLDVERPSGLILLRNWVKERIRIFNNYTLRSLLNQTFRDFHILLICGRRHKSLTGHYPFHGRVERIYPEGGGPIGATFLSSPLMPMKPTLKMAEYEKYDTDFISITRLDSDDLLHFQAMEETRSKTIALIKEDPQERLRLLFRHYIYWDRLNRFISMQKWESPPFFTHVFPRKIYKNWDLLQPQHFVNHRFLDKKRSDPIEMSKYKICAQSHALNIARIKRGHSLPNYTAIQIKKFRKLRFPRTTYKETIIKHLEPFGIKPEEI